MDRFSEACQALVAIAMISAAVILHLKGAPVDGFDSAVELVTVTYFGAKGVQVIKAIVARPAPPAPLPQPAGTVHIEPGATAVTVTGTPTSPSGFNVTQDPQ